MQNRFKEKTIVWIGGGIFAAGILASAFLIVPIPLPMYLSYGVMQGFGQGMIYTTILSTAQKWFPGRTGFSSGVIVTANGLFGFFMAPVSRSLLSGVGIEKTFLIIGTFIGISWILASIFIRNPKTGEVGTGSVQAGGKPVYTGKQYTSGEMFRTKKFYFLLATMMFGLIPYLILSPLSQTVQMDRGISASVAVAAVMAGSVCNAATRLCLPTAADKVGRVICVKVVLVVAVSAMLLLVFAPAGITTVCVVMMYACYGGIMGSFPSLSSSIFGMEHSGENYGYVMFGIAVATLSAPAITNTVLGNGYDINAVFASGAFSAALALISLILLEREIKKEKVNACQTAVCQEGE